MIRNLLGESYLDSITLNLHAPAHGLLYWYYRGIGLINTDSNTNYVASHNLIYMSKISIIGNNSRKATFEYNVVGIYIHFEFFDYDTTLTLSDCNFHHINNYITLQITLFPSIMSSRIVMWIKNCNFEYNEHTTGDSQSTVQISILFINVTLFFTNCNFYKNKNMAPLIAIEVTRYNLVDWCVFPSFIQMKYSNFTGNMSPLLDIYNYGPEVLECITHFSMIGPFMVTENNGQKGHIISICNAVVYISGEAIFSYNLNAISLISLYFCNVTIFYLL